VVAAATNQAVVTNQAAINQVKQLIS